LIDSMWMWTFDHSIASVLPFSSWCFISISLQHCRCSCIWNSWDV